MRDIVIAAVAGLAVGGAVGYYVAREVEGRKNEHYINSEIQEANDYWKKHYKNLYKAEGTPTPVNIQVSETVAPETLSKDWIAKKLAERDTILAEMEDTTDTYKSHNDEPEEVETVEEQEKNVFEEAAEKRDPTIPYLISIDEFMEDRQDFDKISVTYFEGDETVIDEKEETPLDQADRLLGDEFAEHFGEKSRDKDTVYYRNEALEVDFEITRDDRSFEEWVLGPRPKAQTKKMREDD